MNDFDWLIYYLSIFLSFYSTTLEMSVVCLLYVFIRKKLTRENNDNNSDNKRKENDRMNGNIVTTLKSNIFLYI